MPGILAAVAEGERLRVDFARGTVENLSQQTTITTDPLPEELLAIIASGGVLASLEARGFLPAHETGA